MSDNFESMSDEQLDALLNSAPSQKTAPQNPQVSGGVEPNYEGMSDAQLDALLAQQQKASKATYGDNFADFITGAGRGIPGAQDVSSAIATGLSYTPFHPKYVPTEGTAGERFEAAKRAQEKAAEKSFERSPWISGAGTAAGIAAMTPVFELAAPAEAMVASKAAPVVSKLPQLAQEMAGHGARGAYQGAIYGAGEGANLDERLENINKGTQLGGIFGGTFGPVGSRLIGATPLTEAEKAAQRMTKATGINANIPSSVSSPHGLTQGLSEAARVAPFSKNVIQEAREQGQKALDESLMKRGKFTPDVDLTRAGMATKRGMQEFFKKVNPEQSNRMWDRLNNTLGGRQNIRNHRLANTENYIQQNLPFLQNLQLPSEELQKMWDRLTHPTTGNPRAFSFKEMRAIQQYVGDKMHSDFFQKGIKDKVLDNLYKNLSEDARNAAAKMNPSKGLQHYNAALASTRSAYARKEALHSILGSDFSKGGPKVYEKILAAAQNDPELISQAGMILRRSDPNGAVWKDVTSRAAEQLGRSKANPANAWEPAEFIKNYSKMSDLGKRVLFGAPETEQRKALEDVFKASQAYVKSGKSQQYSKLMFALFAGIPAAAGFMTHGPSGVATTGLGMYGVSHLLAMPRLAHLWARVLENPTMGRINRFREVLLSYGGTKVPNPNYSVTTMDDRTQRADGGKVGNRDYPAKRLNKVERALKKAQDALALETKPLMQKPDEQIAQALRIAKGE